MEGKQKEYVLTLEEIYKIADSTGLSYYHFLHIVMGQETLSTRNERDFIKWIKKNIDRDLKPLK